MTGFPEDVEIINLDKYGKAGQTAIAFETIRNIKPIPPFDKAPFLGYLLICHELEDIDNAKNALEQSKKFIETSGLGQVQSLIDFAQGHIYELEGQFLQAIQSYEKLSKMEQSILANIAIGRCYRKLKDANKAEKY